ncbi:MAG: MBL fold metallo-hydrolase [Pyrinomonadaceae bacterium]|nr:MBL fold metallo-hydrolase [Pyrinomonadaceae bacterium]
MKKLLSALIMTAIVGTMAFAHDDNSHFEKQQEVTVKVTKISGNVYMLQGRGGNIGAIVGQEGILIIDDDYKVVSEKLSAALKELGSAIPKYIVNTHWHGDHTEGNEFFGKQSVIIAHEKVRKRLTDPPVIFGQKTAPYQPFALPTITYSERMHLYFDGDQIDIVYLPAGHTDGDTMVFFNNAKVVHLGDHFFNGRFPFVDLASGGSVQGLINNIGTATAMMPADVKVIPGHGPLATLDDVKSYQQTLTETVGIIQNAMKKGMSLDEIKKAGLPEKYKAYGSGFIKTDAWIETVYNSYSKK